MYMCEENTTWLDSTSNATEIISTIGAANAVHG